MILNSVKCVYWIMMTPNKCTHWYDYFINSCRLVFHLQFILCVCTRCLKKLLLFFIFNNFLIHSWMIIKFWKYIAEECTILWVWLCSITLSLFCYHAFFSTTQFRFCHISPAMYVLKTLRVCTACIQDKKGIHSNLGHLLCSLQSMEGISNEKMSAFPYYRC